jgi:hypothetical protein
VISPAFIKLSGHAPWRRVWLNGCEWAKRQLERRGVVYEPRQRLPQVADLAV